MKKSSTKNGTINLATGVGYRKRRWRPWMTWTVVVVGVVIIGLGGTAAYYYPKAKTALADAKGAVAAAKKIPTALSAQQFPSATADVQETLAKISATKNDINAMQGLTWWPYVGRQYTAVRTLLNVGDDSVQAMGTLVTFLQDVFAPFQGRGKISLATITPAEKGALLGNMSAKGDELRQAQERIDQAAASLNTIPNTGLLPQLADGIKQIKDQFPTITQALDEAIPATKVFPSILGYPTDKNYLFLMENNSELRPGGGFIGTYGLMRVSSGEIASLKTDNVYNIDDAGKKTAIVTPPAQIAKYLRVNRWWFRDSNWSPDFPTSAAQALYLYQHEGGSKNIDGVIAVTPTAIAGLLKLVGPITAYGIQFTSDNFVDTLQYQVEKGFLRANIPEAERKDIIGNLTSTLMSRILNLPLTQWKDLFVTMSGDLEAKQVLIWVNDPAVQNIMVSQNWAGAVDQRTGTDYVMVVDANLASLKTDEVMKRTYTYQVAPDGNGAKATLTIHYQNTGKFDWKTTRYNTFVRVYVPAGSTLLDEKGAQLRAMSPATGPVTTSTELGKTVFSAFKSVEPGTSSDLTLTYTLPAAVAVQWNTSQYNLIWQKQPGMIAPNLNISIASPKVPKLMSGVDSVGQLRRDVATFAGSLDKDRTIGLTY